MRLFFIRHGQSENNALWAKNGTEIDRVPDPNITDMGRRQIEATARFLDFCLTPDLSAGTDITCGFETGNIVLYCSLMSRAIQSAIVIGERLNIPVLAHLDIHESGGIYRDDPETGSQIGEKGLSKDEIERLYPQVNLPSKISKDGWWDRPFEERDLRKERVKRVLAWLREAYAPTNDTILMVSHAGFYNYFMREALGIDHDAHIWFEFFNGAITLFNFDNDNVNIFYCNRFDFIPIDIVS